MLSRVKSLAFLGVEGYIVEVEVYLARGLPSFEIVGLPDTAVRESRERVRAAIKNTIGEFPVKKIIVNLAPADIRKEGPLYDLPVALGIIGAFGMFPEEKLQSIAVVGELSLTGEIRKVRGMLPMAIAAKENGIDLLICPRKNLKEVNMIGINSIGMRSLKECLNFLIEGRLPKTCTNENSSKVNNSNRSEPMKEYPDFLEIKGQGAAKRALEVASAGGHNILMIGPPGSGKTMLARSIPGILPPMTGEEALEVTRIYSITGLLEPGVGLVRQRPFRRPHHSITRAGLVGGGKIPEPGEISLAHNGVLFLDELPEFNKSTLDLLRQPMEEGRVTLVRSRVKVSYPAKFMLVGAMNPCPCGYLGHPVKECRCSYSEILRYQKRISGPLLDRIDIQLEVPPLKRNELVKKSCGDSSKKVRERVTKARLIQQKRFADIPVYCNAQMGRREIARFCSLTTDAKSLLEKAIDRLGLNARAFDRILKVARTVADLSGEKVIDNVAIGEAIQYRSFDRERFFSN